MRARLRRRPRPSRAQCRRRHGRSGRLRRELAAGALAQVNALSLLGLHGPEAERAAYELISNGLVAAVASDAHGTTRPPALSLGRARLAVAGVAEALARELTASGPRRLLVRGIAAPLPLPA